MTLEWLIIGGGIHGVHIASRLLADADVPREGVRIVDPNSQLLERWDTRTATTGMSHLRSPSVHHLDLDPLSLQRFAGKRKNRASGLFAIPFERPSLKLFNDHCRKVIRDFELEDLHIQGQAVKCRLDHECVTVELSEGEPLTAQNVVLAMGTNDHPAWPEWAPREHSRVHHVFDPECSEWPSEKETVVVVGGGISAGHVALRLLGEGHDVHLTSRHALREHQFDSDPGWLGPKYTTSFHSESDPDERRAVITEARHRGSMPADMARSIRRAISKGRMQWHEDEITSCEADNEQVKVTFKKDSEVTADRVLLATGYAAQRPGGSMIDELVASAQLPCAKCGYPIVNPSLEWHPHIYVSGPLAELELGPVSRNIAGARRAGDRIVAAAEDQRSLAGANGV